MKGVDLVQEQDAPAALFDLRKTSWSTSKESAYTW